MSEPQKRIPSNRDPLTGATGAHPVGTGVGAAIGGAAAGAAVGTIAGPVGTAVGAAAGAVAGGLFGKGVAEGLDPTVEDAYWREHFRHRPYIEADSLYERYQPAYRYGWEARARMGNRSWRDSETQLRGEWEAHPDSLVLDWASARGPMQDAYDRVPLEPGSTVHRV